MTSKELQEKLKGALSAISEGQTLQKSEIEDMLRESFFLCKEYESKVSQVDYLQSVMKRQIEHFREILGMEEER